MTEAPQLWLKRRYHLGARYQQIHRQIKRYIAHLWLDAFKIFEFDENTVFWNGRAKVNIVDVQVNTALPKGVHVFHIPEMRILQAD